MKSCGSDRPRSEPYVRLYPYTVYGSQWSQCLTQGSRVRSAFSRATGEKGLRSHAIRWMAQFGEAVQVYARFKIVKVIVNSAEVGCESLMNTLRAIIDAPARGTTSSITWSITPFELFAHNFFQ